MHAAVDADARGSRRDRATRDQLRGLEFVVALLLLHGLSDWSTQLSTQWYWIGFLALSLALFLGYSMSASAIERQVRKTPIFRGESMLMDRPSDVSEVPAPSLASRADPEPGVSVRPG